MIPFNFILILPQSQQTEIYHDEIQSNYCLRCCKCISVQSAEAWSIQFQDYSAQTPEYSEKLTNMKDNFCCTTGLP